MPVPFNLAAPAGPLEMMRHEEQYQGSGSDGEEEQLPMEDDGFYDTAEFEDMEAQFRSMYCLADQFSECRTLRGLVSTLRAFADSLEAKADGGWEMDPEYTLADDGAEFELRHPEREREQWRLRRQRRRAALAAERGEQGALQRGGLPGSTAIDMDQDDGGPSQQAQLSGPVARAVPPAAAGAAVAAEAGLKSPPMARLPALASAAFDLF